MTEEQRHELFKPFAQAGDSRRAGLGLSICQRLAALMKATIAVQSTPGRGTTVSLTVRLKVADAGALPHTASVHALRRITAVGEPAEGDTARPVDDGVLAEVCAGDNDLAQDILRKFHRYNAEDTALLANAVLRADVDQVAYASHRIQEASKTIGANALAAICEQVERAARAGDWEAVARHMDGYQAEVLRLERLVASLAT